MTPVPPFDRAVPSGGYAWWYVDALDAEGRNGLAIIGFVGSVFSPYYALARRRAGADPVDFCSINVGLYPAGGHHWTMTERARASVQRSATHLAIGPSAMHWNGQYLQIDIDEITVPLPRRIRGSIRVHPLTDFGQYVPLEPAGRHRWRPYFPRADVEVELTAPQWRWRGTAYCDYNDGAGPLEADFAHWQWTRAHLEDHATAVDYDAQPRGGPSRSFRLRVDRTGATLSDWTRERRELGRTAWGLARTVASEAGCEPRLIRGLESGPFYARSLLGIDRAAGATVHAVHETLSLDRFAAPWVRTLLPFRMPRPPWAAAPLPAAARR